MIGQYIELHINGKKRPYNPISRIDEPGQVDFLITDLRKTNGPNSFTNHLLSMTVQSLLCLGKRFSLIAWPIYSIHLQRIWAVGMGK